MELWLIRHGETPWNHEGRIQGWMDVPLNETGVQQAVTLSSLFRKISVSQFLSSDLQRAVTTARLLQQNNTAPLLLSPLLRERCFGQREGGLRPSVWGEEVRPTELTAEKFISPVDTYPSPEGESWKDFQQRVEHFLRDVLQRFNSLHRVAAVTHGGFIRMTLKVLGFVPPENLHNTAITRLQWNGQNFDVVDVNWSGHLSSERTTINTESDIAE